jgi:hypothetical protein
MEPKKIKKLVLKQEIISNLTENGMSYIKGGQDTEGTGLGPCICNPTDYCQYNTDICPSVVYSCYPIICY